MKEVLYRKFRPDKFHKMVGQDNAVDILKASCSEESFHHAWILAGASGSGKTTAARILASVVNCTNRKEGSDQPCGECHSCVAIRENSSGDFREIDGGSSGGKDEIQKVIECGMFSPSSMKKRVFVIDEAHAVSSAAWAALLKPTEEPSSHVMYIFCTSEYSKIPGTASSRCRRINFRPISERVIADYLYMMTQHIRKSGSKVPECTKDACMQIAMVSNGNMRAALNYIESMHLVHSGKESVNGDEARDFLGLVGKDVLYGIVDAIADGNTGKALEVLISLSVTAPDYMQVCRELGNIFRNILHLSAGVDSAVTALGNDRDLLMASAKKISIDRACLFSDMFTDALGAFEVNTDRRWVLESLVARLSMTA